MEKIKEKENRLKKKQQEMVDNVSFYPGFHSWMYNVQNLCSFYR